MKLLREENVFHNLDTGRIVKLQGRRQIKKKFEISKGTECRT